jgi:TolA-binding protein
MKLKLFVAILLVTVSVVSCSRRRETSIEPPPVGEPPVVTEPQPPLPVPPVEPPPEPPRTPKKALPPSAPKPKAASPGDTSALKIVESGVKKMNAGNLEEAEQYFEQALRVSPNNGRPYYYLGVLAVKQRNYDRALAFLAQAETHLHGDSFWMSQILLQQGLIFKAQNQKSRAVEKLREAVSRDPTNTSAQNELKALTKQ